MRFLGNIMRKKYRLYSLLSPFFRLKVVKCPKRTKNVRVFLKDAGLP
jgi:hypothetical protein